MPHVSPNWLYPAGCGEDWNNLRRRKWGSLCGPSVRLPIHNGTQGPSVPWRLSLPPYPARIDASNTAERVTEEEIR